MKVVLRHLILSLLAFALSGCQKPAISFLDLKFKHDTNDTLTLNNTDEKPPELSLSNCVHVYYDRTPPTGYESLGAIYATNLLNLLGHFAEYQRHVSAVEDYKAGDIHKCSVNFYVDTNYYTQVPATFINDFNTTTTQVAWLGTNSWKLGSALKTTFGVQYNSTSPYTTLDWNNTVGGKPSFFKDVYYKGEKFYKYGDWGKSASDQDTFYAPFEISKFDYNVNHVSNLTDHRILAEIEQNFSLEKLPWAVQSGNKFLFSEVPFSFMHEADRYFIFADLLFDILKAAPRHNSKPAVIRLEDVHSEVSLQSLEKARLIFKQNNVNAHVSIIPIFNNPLNQRDPYVGLGERPLTMNPNFVAKMNEYKADGNEFIWHGVTHQLGNKLNPWESNSGSDYEFWDFSHDVETNHPLPLVGRPVPGETPYSLINLFKKGADALKAANIYPQVWLTPHYHGSSMSNYVFGQLFSWNIGRVVYYSNTMKGLDLNLHHEQYKFPNMSQEAWNSHRQHLKNLKVDQELRQNGQLFPYEIYGDVYGQRLFPENIGNVNRELSEQVLNTRTTEQILEDAARNRVLRDVWGSAFYHPYLLDEPYWLPNYTLSNNDLNDMIVGLKNLGYNFISLEQKSAEWKHIRAKKVNYR